MNRQVIEIGDKIRVERPLYRHVGIYVGPQPFMAGEVVHNDKGDGVILSTLSEFSRGSPIFLDTAASGNRFERQAIARRALLLIGTKFDLVNFNCEHAASFAQTGKAESPQLQGLLVVAVLAGAIALLARKS